MGADGAEFGEAWRPPLMEKGGHLSMQCYILNGVFVEDLGRATTGWLKKRIEGQWHQIRQQRGHAALATKLTLIMIGVLSALQCEVARGGNQASQFFVKNADSISTDCEKVDYRQRALACHRIIQGGSTVIAVREHHNRWIQNDQFTKLTIKIPSEPHVGERYDLSQGSAGAFYSTGLSSSPGKAGCYGKASSGNVVVVNTSKDRIHIEVDAVFDLGSPAGWNQHCSRLTFKAKIKAGLRDFAELGPWEGVTREADDVLSESEP